MGNNTRAPIIKAPELLDVVINNIQTGLTENLGWLDKAFGRAERLVKYGANQKKIYTPNIYIGGNEYQEVTPDAGIGNFSFLALLTVSVSNLPSAGRQSKKRK